MSHFQAIDSDISWTDVSKTAGLTSGHMGYRFRGSTRLLLVPRVSISPLPVVNRPPGPTSLDVIRYRGLSADCRYHNREVSYSSLLDLSITARQRALYDKHGLDIEKWTEMGEWA